LAFLRPLKSEEPQRLLDLDDGCSVDVYLKTFEYGLGIKVEMTSHLLVILMPECQHRVVELRLLVEQSIACKYQENGEKEAVRWADGFRFSKDISRKNI